MNKNGNFDRFSWSSWCSFECQFCRKSSQKMNWTPLTIPSLDLPTCLDHLSHLERKWQQGLRSSTLLKIQKMAICCCLRTGIVAITKIGRQWKCVSKGAKLATNHNNKIACVNEVSSYCKFGIMNVISAITFKNMKKQFKF